MSRTARPLGGFLSTVVLLAVLAITTGWTAPPAGPGAVSRDAIAEDRGAAAAAARIEAAAASRARLLAATTVRATAVGAAWDARAAALDAASSPALGTPGEPPPASGPTSGARTVPSVEIAATGNLRTYKGRNHFWIPSLGMSYRVVPFPCDRVRPPDNYMYRWGCAKHNNVYLMGHAHSVMNALHDAYVAGRLRVGMVAIYADGSGRIRKYEVTEWRVVDPSEVAWQIAAQPVPSMTLQTCVGKNNQWRLNVRLVATN